MAISVDSTSSDVGTDGVTVAHTVGAGSGRMLVVSVQSEGNVPSGVTWNSTALAKARQDTVLDVFYTSIWYLADPEVGSFNVVASNGSNDTAAEVISLFGADGTVGANNGASDFGDTASVTVTVSGDAGMVIDSQMNGNGAATVGAGQTQIAQEIFASARGGGASYEAHTGSNVTMSWSLTPSPGWCISALEIVEASAPAATGNFFLMF